MNRLISPLDRPHRSLVEKLEQAGVERRLVGGVCTESEDLLSCLDSAVEEAAAETPLLKQNDVEFVVERLIEETADVEASCKDLESEIFQGGKAASVDEVALMLVWAFDRVGGNEEAVEGLERLLARRDSFCCEEEAVASLMVRLKKAAITEVTIEEAKTPAAVEEGDEVSREVLEKRSRELKEQIRNILRRGNAGLGFYSSGNWLSVPGASEVRSVGVFLKKAFAALESEFPDHPTVGNCRGVVERLLELPVADTRASEVLGSAEILLDAVEQLMQSLPSEVGNSLLRKDVTLRDLRSGVAKLRAAELASWREIWWKDQIDLKKLM